MTLLYEDQKALCLANFLHFKQPELAAGASSGDVLPELKDHLSIKAEHVTSNVWPRGRKGKELRNNSSRSFMHGVEIRKISEPGHVLSGQNGLFVTRPFQKFDIIGEYMGKVTERSGGEYCAYLEESSEKINALGLDGQEVGNEARMINHYKNIADAPNVIMKICYVERLPRVMVVCKRDISIGEELLLNYGDEYTDRYHSEDVGPSIPVPKETESVAWTEMPGGSRSFDSDKN